MPLCVADGVCRHTSRVAAGDDLYVKGVYNDGADGGLRLTKEFSSGGVFSVVGAVVVSERGLRSGSVREAFELTGDRMYNPSWGRQEGACAIRG